MKKIAILFGAAALVFSWCVPAAMADHCYRRNGFTYVNPWNSYPVYSGRSYYNNGWNNNGWNNRRAAKAWRKQMRREQRAWRHHQRQAARWNGWY